MEERIATIRGDLSGLAFPTDLEALQADGLRFLTTALRKRGTLEAPARVAAIENLAAFEGGSTGRKAQLTVRYEGEASGLDRRLFVKFSRDWNNPQRDLTRVQMASEIYMANLSAMPGFPVLIPRCYFADYHAETGTGLLITERVAFGEEGIEPLQPKSVDHRYQDAPAHYQRVLQMLGTLAGTHRAGRLPPVVDDWFPYAPQRLLVNTRKPPDAAALAAKIDDYEAFISTYPGLMPQRLCSRAFLRSLREGAPLIAAAERRIFDRLAEDSAYIALCHWNAQLDNAWFWRDQSGYLQCGLMDWGNAGQMNVAMAIWGCLCGAEMSLWHSLDALVEVFVEAFAAAGGQALKTKRLIDCLDLYIAHMGVRYMLDSPAAIRARMPAGQVPASYLDEVVQSDERTRSQLAILSNFLGRWEARDYVELIRSIS